MDIATVVGFVAGAVILCTAILMGSDIGTFIDIPSVLITIGGSYAAMFIHYPMEKITSSISIMLKSFSHTARKPGELIGMILDFATIARKEGVLALEAKLEEINDPFIRKGVQMVVDGTPPELTREILELDMDHLEDRHKEGQGFFMSLGTYAPAFGMIGTLIGLVQMLKNMEDPSSIGAGMAVALITTLYGAIMANLVCLPIAGKLKIRGDEEVLLRRIVIEGIQSIQAGESPRVVEEKLKVFMPPKERDQFGQK
jgi:chemotaxis protein MotA